MIIGAGFTGVQLAKRLINEGNKVILIENNQDAKESAESRLECQVFLEDGSEHISVTNIGVRPTVSDENSVSVESFILDFNGNLYDRHVRVEFYKYLRPEKKFTSPEELAQQIYSDAETAKVYFQN